ALLATGNSKDGTSWIKKAADLGDASAAAAYSAILERGDHGVAVDGVMSRQYQKQAADLGDAHSQYALASHLFEEKNLAETARYATMAAELGHPEASYFVGNLHYAGVGVPQDLDISLSWHRKASALGSAG